MCVCVRVFMTYWGIFMITHPQYQDTCKNQDDFKVLIFLSAKQHSRNLRHGPRPKILCMASLQVLQSVSRLVVCFSVGGTGGVLAAFFSSCSSLPLWPMHSGVQEVLQYTRAQKENNSRQHGSFNFPEWGGNHFALIPENIPAAAAREDASLVSI